MSNPRRLHRLLAVAGLAAVAAWLCGGLSAAADRDLHAGYARLLAGESRTQAALLVAIDDATLAEWGAPPWAPARIDPLARAIEAGAPRLVIWPEGQAASAEQIGDPDYRGAEGRAGVDPLLGPALQRVAEPEFPARALARLGLPARDEPLPTRYVAHLPVVAAHRVAAGEIPAGTFSDRLVIVGRTDAATATIATPLGLLSPAQVEAHALLGALDGEVWAPAPAWWWGPLACGAWALLLAAALRGRGPAAIGVITLCACAAALALDAALFAAGLLRLGAGAAVVVVIVTAAARVLGLSERGPADLSERSGASAPVAEGASGLHKVSGA
jgi:CHASE2 domain-containing sensor protein